MDDNRIEGTAKKVAGKIQSAYGDATDNASQELKGDVRKAIGSAQNAFGKAEDCVRDSIESVHSHISEKPVQSTLIALGVGFLLSRLLRL